jgi:hypothetical protein
VKQADLKAFLDVSSPEARKVVLALRKMVRRAVPHAVESLVWALAGLTFERRAPGYGG